jgi:hypothetical protein
MRPVIIVAAMLLFSCRDSARSENANPEGDSLEELNENILTPVDSLSNDSFNVDSVTSPEGVEKAKAARDSV